MTLTDRLPGRRRPRRRLRRLRRWAAEQGLTLYPAQEEALIELVSGAQRHPQHADRLGQEPGRRRRALRRARRRAGARFYTAPIKALVSEKFFALCATFGADNVGMMTGDASVNADAPIICCTAEILANIALREGADADVGQVVMDEFHFYADPDRGWAWQVPLLELPQAQFLLMSATLGDVTPLRGRPDPAHRPADRGGQHRPSGRCRCTSTTRTTPLHETLEELLATQPGAGLRRALHPGRGARAGAGADEHQRLHPRGEGRDRRADRRLPVHRRLRQDAVAAGPARHRRAPRRACCRSTAGWWSARPGRPAQGHLRHRHPRRRHQRADPHRAVHRRCRKYDGSRTRLPQGPRVPPDRRPGRPGRLRHRRHRRRAGARARRRERAGRWPRPATTRRSAARSCARSRRRASSLGRADLRPAGRRRARAADLAASRSATRCCSTSSPGPATRSPRCGTCSPTTTRTAPRQRRHIRRAIAIYRALLAAGVVERLDRARRRRAGTVRLTVDLQPDFALNQPLSPFALAALELLDRGVADVRPRRRLGHRVDPRRPAAGAVAPSSSRPAARPSPQMKAEGIEYEERMELLEDVTYPQAAAPSCSSAALRDLPARPPVGRRPRARARSRWPATCTSGR